MTITTTMMISVVVGIASTDDTDVDGQHSEDAKAEKWSDLMLQCK